MAEGRLGSYEPPPKVRRSGEETEREDEIELCRINIDSLPDEVMINIFSSISFNDLVDNVQDVCVRWKRLAHDPVLWLDKEFIIRGSKGGLKGRGCCGVVWSKCVHCRCEGKDEKILRTAGRMPQLRKLTLMRNVKACVLEEICTNWPNLTNLKIDGSQIMEYSLMKHIFEKCPKIQKLKLGSTLLVDQQCAKLLSILKHLSSLEMFVNNPISVRMSVLADACPQLEEINFQWDGHDIEDADYFLKAKRHSLTSATLYWTLGRIETMCVLPLLKQCHKLKKLQLSNFEMPLRMYAAAFEALGELHSLQELSILPIHPRPPEVISLAFRPGCLTQLQRLKLVTPEMQDETLVAISRNCPNLCELRLHSRSITDVALSELHHLKHLKILELSACGLRGSAVAHIAQLPALHALVLKDFDLTSLQPSLQHIVNMKELRYLDILESCNIQAVPFVEFPGKLVKLRELRVTYDEEEEVFCKNVFADLQHKMPHLRVFNTYWLKENDYPREEESSDDDWGSYDSGDCDDYVDSPGYAIGYYGGYDGGW